MTPVFKAIPAILLSVPLMAQSSWIAARIGHIEGASYLLYIGERSDPLYQGLQALLISDELVEMGTELGAIQTSSPNYPNLARELGLKEGSRWALANSRGRCLLQGIEAPSAAEIREALDEAGAKGPIRVLRDFLKAHPDHLEARQQLLERLRGIAYARTRHALELTIDDPSGPVWTDPKAYARARSPLPDTSQLEGAQLEPEDDIRIWGPYAQELETLFSSVNWRLIQLPNTPLRLPLEACSPTMVLTYRRHNAKVEAWLEELSSDTQVWSYYAWTKGITKQRSVRSLLDRIVPAPYSPLPTAAMALLFSEEGMNNNWGFLAETLMSNWPKTYTQVLSTARNIKRMLESSEGNSRVTYYPEGVLELTWQQMISPLLESLIRANRIADAETVLRYVARFPEYTSFHRRAAELALGCGRKDLNERWQAAQIAEESADNPETGELLSHFYQDGLSHSYILMLLNANELDYQQVNSLLKKSRLIGWRLVCVSTGSELSEMVMRREGWLGDSTYWGLLEKNGGFVAHGFGLPDEETLYQALAHNNIETPADILRRFTRQYPTQLEAKQQLLYELKRLAEHNSKEKLGEGAGTNTAMLLSEEDDREIWGEYASLYRNFMPYFLSQGRQQWTWYASPWSSAHFIHSKTMKNVAHQILPQIEESLRRQPTNNFLWEAWVYMSDLLESPRLFRNLMGSLVLSPMDRPSDTPPTSARISLLKQYHARENWQGIIDVSEMFWEETLEGYTATEVTQDSAITIRMAFMSKWEFELRYLLEAYLSLEKEYEANELARALSQSPIWAQVKPAAIELAERCGRTALAKQWRRMD